MNSKKTLSTTILLLMALSVFSALSVPNLNSAKVSAVPDSPYIMAKPDRTLNSTYTVGNNYTVSIYTNYDIASGNDAYMWQFSLTFNPSILEGIEVRNGDLINMPSVSRFYPGIFNNTMGQLSLTVAYFDHSTTKYTTTGPGTLANVTFRVKGYGISDIHVSDAVADPPTVLGGYNIAKGGYYEIIDGTLEPEKLGHGFFNNFPGDANGDGVIDIYDLITVAVAFGSVPGDPNWNPVADINRDGTADIYDIIIVAINFGKTIP